MNVWVAFAKARLDNDEQVAKAAEPGPWRATRESDCEGWAIIGSPGYVVYLGFDSDGGVMDDANAEHIARHDPPQVLRQVAAMRQILELHDDECCAVCLDDVQGCPTYRAVASIWSDHEDYPGRVCGARTVFWPDVEACEAACSLPAHSTGRHSDPILGEWSEDDMPTIHPDDRGGA